MYDNCWKSLLSALEPRPTPTLPWTRAAGTKKVMTPQSRCPGACFATICAALLTLPFGAVVAGAATATVPDDFPTIQQAIDSGANEILIRPGIYSESPVISDIPPNPDDWRADDLILRGLVPAGTASDSLPVIAGLVFDDLTEFYVHSPSISLTDLRFSKVIENTFDTNPYSNPLVIAFTRCVLDSASTMCTRVSVDNSSTSYTVARSTARSILDMRITSRSTPVSCGSRSACIHYDPGSPCSG